MLKISDLGAWDVQGHLCALPRLLPLQHPQQCPCQVHIHSSFSVHSSFVLNILNTVCATLFYSVVLSDFCLRCPHCRKVSSVGPEFARTRFKLSPPFSGQFVNHNFFLLKTGRSSSSSLDWLFSALVLASLVRILSIFLTQVIQPIPLIFSGDPALRGGEGGTVRCLRRRLPGGRPPPPPQPLLLRHEDQPDRGTHLERTIARVTKCAPFIILFLAKSRARAKGFFCNTSKPLAIVTRLYSSDLSGWMQRDETFDFLWRLFGCSQIC